MVMVHSFRPVRFHERTAVDDGSVVVSGATFTYFGTTQYAYLDQNGAWQAASSPSSNTAYFGVGETTNWSLVGSGTMSLADGDAYDNAMSGSITASGSGTDSYAYRQYYSYSSADGGEWTPTGSGDGYADGSGSVTFSYSGGGAYSNIDSNWEWSPSDTDSPAGTAKTAAWLGQTQNGSWSGSVLASGDATQSYGYSTDSTYTFADGWTSTGTTSASVSGSMSASFWPARRSRSSIGDSYNGASFGGTVSGSGADWANYSFAQSQNLSGGAWSSASGAAPPPAAAALRGAIPAAAATGRPRTAARSTAA